MPEQTYNLTLFLRDDVDDEALEQLTIQLCDEIEVLDVKGVRPAPGITSLPGAKGDPVTVGTIVVALASAGVFTGLIQLVQSWVRRRDDRKVTIKVKDHDHEVEVSASTSPDKMQRFVNKVLNLML